MGDNGNGDPFSEGAVGFNPFGDGGVFSDCKFCGSEKMHQFLFLMILAGLMYLLWTIFED